MGERSGYIEEIKFEMNGHVVIAWMPAPGHRNVAPSQTIPSERIHWLIEIDGGPNFPGPVYQPLETGQELRAEWVIRAFLRDDVRASPPPRT